MADSLPVVFVHGAAGSSAVWRHQIAALSGRYPAVAFDLPGHGKSTGEPAKTIADLAKSVEDFIAAERLERLALAGHSMGGAVILAMALRDPSAYRGLVLVGTGGRLRILPEMIAKAEANDPAAFDLLIEYGFGPGGRDDIKEELRREADSAGNYTLWCDLMACNEFTVLGQLDSLGMPALAIVGTEDRLTPVKYAQYFHDHLPDCKLVIIENAGHWVMLEQPERVSQAIAEFLENLD